MDDASDQNQDSDTLLNDWEQISSISTSPQPSPKSPHINPILEQSNSSSSSSSSSSSPPSPPSSSSSSSPSPSNSRPLWRRFEVVRARIASRARRFAVFTTSFWSIFPLAGVTVIALVTSLLYARFQKLSRRRRGELLRDEVDRLACLLKEKDEKIGHLMLQIEQMNEAVSARRRVPVLRIMN